MRRKLTYAPRALADLDGIRLWLMQPGSGPVARRKLASIGAAIRRLQREPCLYPIGVHAGVRELPCEGGYRVLYEVHPDTARSETAGDVQVLRVFGPGQDRRRP
nr:type II toxin-antitoxin system RelE/ParE family toxin [uncultured Rhodopila sp.]